MTAYIISSTSTMKGTFSSHSLEESETIARQQRKKLKTPHSHALSLALGTFKDHTETVEDNAFREEILFNDNWEHSQRLVKIHPERY